MQIKPSHINPLIAAMAVAMTGWLHASSSVTPGRSTQSLDGLWQIEEGSLDEPPARYGRTAPVPGLVSLAVPPFVEPGPKVEDRAQVPQKDPRRDAFWYRRTFTFAGPVPAVARLKVAKAMFGTRVFLNGTLLGDHAPSFTPGYFDAKAALRPGENELIVRIGADRDAVGRAYPDGFDIEKERYIPGLFDSVELILSGTPHVESVQVAPDITARVARVQVQLRNTDAAARADCTFTVREAKSGKIVGATTTKGVELAAQGAAAVEVRIPIEGCRLWSPEEPFLYRLEVSTGADSFQTRFGMRTFTFDPATGRALLNGKPYFMRGSNVTLYRFFEDPDCGTLPWDEKWVRLLHQRVKDMHGNCLRYCIGFPPEAWYDIADELGVLIQDEFPLWFLHSSMGKWPKELKADELAKEYAEWMRERWNHPCVVVWDSNNETTSDQTALAVTQVRGLDLSGRPWDDSYTTPPAEPGDCFESHPYHFIQPTFKLADMATADPLPQGSAIRNDGKHATIINEYGWLWLNRDGTPTTLTRQLYENLLGTDSTTEQRRHLYALYMAADTEFWRSHRQAAAVMHFTALGYSRPNGQTSDNWLDVKQLQWEPEFYRYMRDAFAPVGVMIDAWATEYPRGREQDFSVAVVNDLDAPWRGALRLRILHGQEALTEMKVPVDVAGLGRARTNFVVALPKQPGRYQVEATLLGTPCGDVSSFREFDVLSPEQIAVREGVAAGKPVTASSSIRRDGATEPAAVVDGKSSTRWSSEFSDPQWLAVDLGAATRISRVELVWEAAYGRCYAIQISANGQDWTDVYKTSDGKGGTETIRFAPADARWVRYVGTQRATAYGHSIREFRVFP